MTDLINKIDKQIKNDNNSIQILVDKFSVLLEETKDKKNQLYLAYIIDFCVNNINENHKNLSKDWKAWSVVVVKNLYLEGKIKKEIDISNIINDFIEYYFLEYENYCNDVISVTKYDRDYSFVSKYINKKIGK
jgi:hypothetical protein